jgi:hypothetical protein
LESKKLIEGIEEAETTILFGLDQFSIAYRWEILAGSELDKDRTETLQLLVGYREEAQAVPNLGEHQSIEDSSPAQDRELAGAMDVSVVFDSEGQFVHECISLATVVKNGVSQIDERVRIILRIPPSDTMGSQVGRE